MAVRNIYTTQTTCRRSTTLPHLLPVLLFPLVTLHHVFVTDFRGLGRVWWVGSILTLLRSAGFTHKQEEEMEKSLFHPLLAEWHLFSSLTCRHCFKCICYINVFLCCCLFIASERKGTEPLTAPDGLNVFAACHLAEQLLPTGVNVSGSEGRQCCKAF